jgi:hypothetical protein
MKIFQKKKDGSQPQPQSKIEKRVASIATPDLVSWAENALFVIGKELTGWMKSKSPTQLDEALLGAEALLAIAKELKKRSEYDR